MHRSTLAVTTALVCWMAAPASWTPRSPSAAAPELRRQRRAAQLRLPRQHVVRLHPSGSSALQHAVALRARQLSRDRRATWPSPGRCPTDGLTYTFKLRRTSFPRRLGLHLGRRQGELRPHPRPGRRRALDPPGGLCRHRLDRDPRRPHRRRHPERAQRGHAGPVRVAVGLHLQRREARRKTRAGPSRTSWAPARSPSSSIPPGPIGSASASTTTGRRQALSRRLPRHLHERRADGERACRRRGAGGVPRPFAGRPRPAGGPARRQDRGVRNPPGSCSLIVTFNTEQEAVRRRARAPGAVAGHRPLHREPRRCRASRWCAMSAGCCAPATNSPPATRRWKVAGLLQATSRRLAPRPAAAGRGGPGRT
jgi:hypothetical protein